MLHEQRGNAGITYVYEQDSYVPLARLDRTTDGMVAKNAGNLAGNETGKPVAPTFVTVDKVFYSTMAFPACRKS